MARVHVWWPSHAKDTKIQGQGHRWIQTTQETVIIPDSLLTQLCYWIINEGEKENKKAIEDELQLPQERNRSYKCL